MSIPYTDKVHELIDEKTCIIHTMSCTCILHYIYMYKLTCWYVWPLPENSDQS